MSDNSFASVGAIVFRDNKVLLVRHTYGSAKGKLINPGGRLQQGEMPEDAVKREVYEETGETAEPLGVLAVRCSHDGWYMVYLCRHTGGEPRSDGAENSEAVYISCDEALSRPDLTDTAKTLIRIGLEGKAMKRLDCYKGRVMYSANRLI